MPKLPRITIKLVGSDKTAGDVLLGDFRGFCTSLSLCLRKTETIISGDAKLRYRIADMKSGSAVLTLEPVAGAEGFAQRIDAIPLFVETVQKLEAGDRIDSRFRNADLEAFRGLVAKRLGHGLSSISISGTKITTQYLASIDRILNEAIPSDGSVTGRLERLNIHNKLEFALYPPVGGTPVVCLFPEVLFGKVRMALRANVTVHGKLFFKPENPFPERVIVRELEQHPPDSELPSLRSLRGMLSGALGQVDVVSFLRSHRDE